MRLQSVCASFVSFMTCGRCCNGKKVETKLPNPAAKAMPKPTAPSTTAAAPIRLVATPAASNPKVVAALAARNASPFLDDACDAVTDLSDADPTPFATMQFHDLSALKLIAHAKQPDYRAWQAQIRKSVRDYFLVTLHVSEADYGFIASSCVNFAGHLFSAMRASSKQSDADLRKAFEGHVNGYFKAAMKLLSTLSDADQKARLETAVKAFRNQFGGALAEPGMVVVAKAVVSPERSDAERADAVRAAKAGAKPKMNGHAHAAPFGDVTPVALRTRHRSVKV